MSQATCPICKTDAPRSGRVVHNSPAKVAGIEIDLGDIAYSMHRCPRCSLEYKSPFIPESDLVACYERASGDHWEEAPDPHKRRFDDIERAINAHAEGPMILDIGCSNGALLGYMGQSWERFGVEPGEEAAEQAEDRDIRIIAPMLDQLKSTEQFDVILAIDLLEHLLDPDAFMSSVRRHLNPGGILVGLTGDTQSPSWRWQGSRYWYCSLPEHQVFYSRKTINVLSQRHEMCVLHSERLSHWRFRRFKKWKRAVRGGLWGFLMRVGLFPNISPPEWLEADGHMLFVLKATD